MYNALGKYMNIRFKKAVKEDCELLIEINNKAYYADYIRYGECPGYNIGIKKWKNPLKIKKLKNT